MGTDTKHTLAMIIEYIGADPSFKDNAELLGYLEYLIQCSK